MAYGVRGPEEIRHPGTTGVFYPPMRIPQPSPAYHRDMPVKDDTSLESASVPAPVSEPPQPVLDIVITDASGRRHDLQDWVATSEHNKEEEVRVSAEETDKTLDGEETGLSKDSVPSSAEEKHGGEEKEDEKISHDSAERSEKEGDITDSSRTQDVSQHKQEENNDVTPSSSDDISESMANLNILSAQETQLSSKEEVDTQDLVEEQTSSAQRTHNAGTDVSPVDAIFEMFLRHRKAWNPETCPPFPGVLEVRQSIEMYNKREMKDNVLVYHEPSREEHAIIFGTEVNRAHSVRDIFTNKSENPFTHRNRNRESESEATKKHLQSILNKLSEANYRSLCTELLNTKFNALCREPEFMKDVVNMFFDKAINETAFAPLYAQFCQDIYAHWKRQAVEDRSDPTDKSTHQSTTFRRQLLEHCREAFMSGSHVQSDPLSEVKEVPAMDDPVHWKRTVGTVKFIGELFKLRLIAKGIMHEISYKMLFSPLTDRMRDNSLLLFCELMESIGPLLENSESEVGNMHIYFENVCVLSATYPNIRVRFKLLNLLELRQRDWAGVSSTALSKTYGPYSQAMPSQEISSKSVMSSSASRPLPPHSTGNYARPSLRGSRRENESPSRGSYAERMVSPLAPNTAKSFPAVRCVLSRTSSERSDLSAMKLPTRSSSSDLDSVLNTPDINARLSNLGSATTDQITQKLEEKAMMALQESIPYAIEIVEVFKINDYNLFLQKCIDTLCSSVQRFGDARCAFGSFSKSILKNTDAKSELSIALNSVIRNWISREQYTDAPKLWVTFAEIVSSLIESGLLPRGYWNDALQIVLQAGEADMNLKGYIEAVHLKTDTSDITGIAKDVTNIPYLRTMSVAEWPESFELLVNADVEESALKEYKAIRKVKWVFPSKRYDALWASRCASVLFTFMLKEKISYESEMCARLLDFAAFIADGRSVKERARNELILLIELNHSAHALDMKEDVQVLTDILVQSKIISTETVTECKNLLKLIP